MLLDTLRHRVQTAIAGAERPAVLFSGGKDSLLIAYLVRELTDAATLIWVRTGEPDKAVRRAIQRLGLLTLSWTSDVYLLQEGDERVIVHEIDLGGVAIPIVTDLAPGERCSRKLPVLTPYINPGFDVLLWGAKDTDTHWLKWNIPFPPDGAQVGAARLYAPLRDLTDAQVLEVLGELGVPYEPQLDALPMCSACMNALGEVYCPELRTMIPSVDTNWAAGVAAFRQRFGETA